MYAAVAGQGTAGIGVTGGRGGYVGGFTFEKTGPSVPSEEEGLEGRETGEEEGRRGRRQQEMFCPTVCGGSHEPPEEVARTAGQDTSITY